MLNIDSKKITIEEAWRALLNKYNIIQEVRQNGLFYITASQINEYKEARLMAKWDSAERLMLLVISYYIKNFLN